MEKEIENLKTYLHEVLHVQVKINLWEKTTQLPLFLGDFYHFYEMTLFKHSYLLMIAKLNIEITPATVRKHWEYIQQKWGYLCIFSQSVISSYNRKRLIAHGVPFIIPGKQMYLPTIGIDLHEHFDQLHSHSIKSFSPATQAVVIYTLLNNSEKQLNPSNLAKDLGYTPMTITRAFDELQAAKLGKIIKKGKERWWYFRGNKIELWEQTKPFLKSPVKYRKWLQQEKSLPIAGLSALSHFSMLHSPSLPVFAIGPAQWTEFKKLGNEILPTSEGALAELEIWTYDPKLFISNGIVDHFSLYLSFEDNKDERIDSALDEIIKKAYV